MADKQWIAAAAQRHKNAREVAAREREQERKDQGNREAIAAPFWEAFAGECENLIREVNASIGDGARLKRGADRTLGLTFESHRVQVSLPRDSMVLHVSGLDRAKLAGAAAPLEVRGNRLVGAKGETPADLANEVMRAFFERAL